MANWGNLVNRSVSFAARNIGSIPEAGQLTDADHATLENSRKAFAGVGESLSRSRFKNAATETMRTLAEANEYLSDQAPWKLRESDPERMKTILHVALQLVDDGKTLLTPFLPGSSQKVFAMLGGEGTWADLPRIDEVTEEGGSPIRSSPAPTPGRRPGGPADQAGHAAGDADTAVRQDRPEPADEELTRLAGHRHRARRVSQRAPLAAPPPPLPAPALTPIPTLTC